VIPALAREDTVMKGAEPGRPQLEFSSRSRSSILTEIARAPLDLLVIGGGINGAGIAREATLRGLRVGLVDKGDFANGTSSRSSRLIHGGFRYLELGDLRLVFAACQERDLLRRRLAPHLVRPVPFLFPVYQGDRRGLAAVTVGLWLYDLLAAFRNIKRHKRLSRRAALELEPELRAEGLQGAGYYYDCWTDDARLTLETLLSAWSEGALVCNYVVVSGFHHRDGRIDRVTLRDVVRDELLEVQARVVVNAAGPWVDTVRTLDDPNARPVVRRTKGVHAVVPRDRVRNRGAVVVRSPSDGRVMFVIPWGDQTLVGTTDTDYDGSPDIVRPERADIDYLLDAVNHCFPSARLAVDDVVSAYAGLRPLVALGTRANSDEPSMASREEAIIVSPSGLVSLAGGKLTTYRRVAVSVVERVISELRRREGDRRRFPRSRSDAKPLLGAKVAGSTAQSAVLLAAADQEHLTGRYGSRIAHLMRLLDEEQTLREPLAPPAADLRGEVRIAAKEEMAVRVEDVLRRRLHVALKNPSQGVDVVADVVGLMGEALGWDDDRRKVEEAAYRSEVAEERRGWQQR
jgi:glycerol-3-phosphate dehydrogenase